MTARFQGNIHFAPVSLLPCLLQSYNLSVLCAWRLCITLPDHHAILNHDCSNRWIWAGLTYG